LPLDEASESDWPFKIRKKKRLGSGSRRLQMPMNGDEFGDRPLTDGMFETLRLAPAPGTPVRPPDRRGHPALAEPPQQVAFVPSWPLRLRLDPDGGPFAYQEDGWRQKIDLPACRLVWIGDVVGSSDDRETPHVRALVQLSPESPEDPFTELTLPLTALPFLSVGRVLKEPPGSDEPQSRYVKGGPSRERRFLGNEWSVDLWLGPEDTSLKIATELPALAIATLADHPHFADAPLYVVTDAARRRLVAIPCWEIFRAYYAGAPRVARLLFDFPRWKAGTHERMLQSFDGHRFIGPARPVDGERSLANRQRDAYAAQQLLAVGRETAVSYATTGRAQIRAVPPIAGPTRLRCVGIPLAFDGCEALFVQQIVFSEPAPEAQAGIGWWSVPARPLFRSHAEAAAWWGAYRCGAVPGLPETPTWSAFATAANRQAEEADRQAEQAELRDLRIHGLRRLRITLERVLRAFPGVSPAA
jgi:hypothetical protein